jgi:hypothetical protein
LALLELSLLLPPHAARPIPRARLQAPARIKRCMRFTGAPLPWCAVFLDPLRMYYVTDERRD